jgi:hypothetical protein
VRTFDSVEELRQALLAFRETYNTTWLIERHGFRTPAAVRQSQLSPCCPFIGQAAQHSGSGAAVRLATKQANVTVTAWVIRLIVSA